MNLPRCSGLLLHVTSLPGSSGIGDLGPEAYEFADFLAEAGQGIWQVLPLHPTGYKDSPYQSLSAFAGNPLLISLEVLVEEGYLSAADLAGSPHSPRDRVDFSAVVEYKSPLLRRAFESFQRDGSSELRSQVESFQDQHAGWLDDYALFMAVKAAHGHRAWTEWEEGVSLRSLPSLEAWGERLSEEVAFHRFLQYLFFRQWNQLRSRCRQLGLRIMGDVPIFVAHDSADVWAGRHLFQLDRRGVPTRVAGVPPDYFSETGQLWGNPLYRWEDMAATGYDWWIGRLRAELELVDVLRLDHFRGFQAYWSVAGDATNAIEGEWVPGPGEALFVRVREALGEVPIIAEDLGLITDDVRALKEALGLPGMAILQFAFGSDMQASDFQPHRFTRNLVAYTGTHDNSTIQGWWNSKAGEGSTRTQSEIDLEREHARRYLASDGREVHWDFIRALQSSVASVVIVPVQDLLGLGDEARMNLPGSEEGNWEWRLPKGRLNGETAARLREMAQLYERLPQLPDD